MRLNKEKLGIKVNTNAFFLISEAFFFVQSRSIFAVLGHILSVMQFNAFNLWEMLLMSEQ